MRAQCPVPHDGHIALLRHVAKENDHLCVVLGEARAVSRKNPLPATYRQMALHKALADHGVFFKNLTVLYHGNEREDSVWAKKLEDSLTLTYFPGADIRLYGVRDTFLSNYHGDLPVVLVQGIELPGLSATAIRQRIYEGLSEFKPTDIEQFNAGYIAGVGRQYPTSYQAVDIGLFLITSDGKGYLALGRKPGETLLRFPGGFVDPTDDDADAGNMLELAAVREFQEELGVEIPVDELNYMGSFRVRDWRYAGLEHRIGTALFGGILRTGTTDDPRDLFKAADDLADVQVVQTTMLNESLFVEEHRPLVRRLMDEYKHIFSFPKA